MDYLCSARAVPCSFRVWAPTEWSLTAFGSCAMHWPLEWCIIGFSCIMYLAMIRANGFLFRAYSFISAVALTTRIFLSRWVSCPSCRASEFHDRIRRFLNCSSTPYISRGSHMRSTNRESAFRYQYLHHAQKALPIVAAQALASSARSRQERSVEVRTFGRGIL